MHKICFKGFFKLKTDSDNERKMCWFWWYVDDKIRLVGKKLDFNKLLIWAIYK